MRTDGGEGGGGKWFCVAHDMWPLLRARAPEAPGHTRHNMRPPTCGPGQGSCVGVHLQSLGATHGGSASFWVSRPLRGSRGGKAAGGAGRRLRLADAHGSSRARSPLSGGPRANPANQKDMPNVETDVLALI